MNDIIISLKSELQIVLNSDIEVQGNNVFDSISIGKKFASYRLVHIGLNAKQGIEKG